MADHRAYAPGYALSSLRDLGKHWAWYRWLAPPAWGCRPSRDYSACKLTD